MKSTAIESEKVASADSRIPVNYTYTPVLVDIQQHSQAWFVVSTSHAGKTTGKNVATFGTSKSRENKTFSGLDLDDNLKSADAEARCGLHVIDLSSGDVVHWIRIEGVVSELYDVVCFPGVVRPQALGFKTDEIRRVLRIGDEQSL